MNKKLALIAVLTAAAMTVWLLTRPYLPIAGGTEGTSPKSEVPGDSAPLSAAVATDPSDTDQGLSQSELPPPNEAASASSRSRSRFDFGDPALRRELAAASQKFEAERLAWRSERGLLTEQAKLRYSALNEDQLEKLASAGDSNAMVELAKRSRDASRQRELLHDAEVLGSLQPALESSRRTEDRLAQADSVTQKVLCSGFWADIFYLELLGMYDASGPSYSTGNWAACDSVMTAADMRGAFSVAFGRLARNNFERAQLGLPPLQQLPMPGHLNAVMQDRQNAEDNAAQFGADFRARHPRQYPPSPNGG